MDDQPAFLDADLKYQAFLQVLTELRPRLHRYCARMTGSTLDGEDVMQEALFEAYRNLTDFDETRPMVPWLLRIVHNRCIDFLRRRTVRRHLEVDVPAPDPIAVDRPAPLDVPAALEAMVLRLPPKERACMLLVEVLDYSLQEAADVVGSTVGSVKAALHRGRAKLAERREGQHVVRRRVSDDDLRVLRLYVDRFNRRDWNGVLELTRADARLLVADAYDGSLRRSEFFRRYESWKTPWRVVVGMIDGEPGIITVLDATGPAQPLSFTRIRLHADGRIATIVHYAHCRWVLPAASSIEILPTG